MTAMFLILLAVTAIAVKKVADESKSDENTADADAKRVVNGYVRGRNLRYWG